MGKKGKDNESIALLSELSAISARISSAERETDPKIAKKFRQRLEQIADSIRQSAVTLDPILRPLSIFDPTDPQTSGRVIALTLIAQARHALGAIPQFYGAGVYAIYYKGTYGPYRKLANTDHPIYVGKADPAYDAAKDAVTQGTKLAGRLREHAKSISKAENLDIDDFDCRFLIVQTGFQKAAEEYLIKLFKPVWNSETKICYGLGKHGDSSKTRVNKRSPWDTLHPGRDWARETLEDQKSIECIEREIETHLNEIDLYTSRDIILRHFFDDMRQLNTDRFFTPIAGTVILPEVDE